MTPSETVSDFLDFLGASPTPYHAVQSATSRLEAAGFTYIRERDDWSSTVQPGGKYYLTRNGSSLVAFAVGRRWKPGNPIAMIGTHTDSPCLRVKPVSRGDNAGFLQVRAETYGRGMWHTWFDRDLSIAGRALVRDGPKSVVQKVVRIKKPILRIPSLTVHLNHASEFDPNIETELLPIAGLVAAELNRVSAKKHDKASSSDAAATSRKAAGIKNMSERHHSRIVELIAEQADVAADDVVDFEMVLYDTQPPSIGGLNDELIHSARLDNQEMTYCSIIGLIEATASADALENESGIRLIATFDHEEIGSTSAQGANSDLLPSVLRRLSLPMSSGAEQGGQSLVDVETAFAQTMRMSFLISADMGHSIHPNYTGKYEENHHPEMNKGCVIKVHAAQKYATNSPGIVLLQEVAREADVPLQLFVVRNDSTCGTTIGPLLAAKLGVRTLDLGNPQLSMHSIRETSGVDDVRHAVDLFSGFFSNYSEFESQIFVE